MPKGYWIAQIAVTDEQNYPKYREAAGPVVAAYGGRFLVRGGRCEHPEGKGYPRNVIVEFDSYDRALACYRSPAYRAAAQLRQDYAESTFVIVEGAE